MSELEVIASEVRACQKCRLGSTRKQAVPGEGNPRAEIFFIGEAPGYWENEQGRPFVGPAGQLLEELLSSIGLKRTDVFIGNVLKCRPPGNRDPFPDEISACADYLDRQIAAIQPRVIVTLGRYSMARFFPPGKSMKELHGKVVRWKQAFCLAMYHPAAALRQPSLLDVLRDDFKRIPQVLAEARAAQPREPEVQARQLNLF